MRKFLLFVSIGLIMGLNVHLGAVITMSDGKNTAFANLIREAKPFDIFFIDQIDQKPDDTGMALDPHIIYQGCKIDVKEQNTVLKLPTTQSYVSISVYDEEGLLVYALASNRDEPKDIILYVTTKKRFVQKFGGKKADGSEKMWVSLPSEKGFVMTRLAVQFPSQREIVREYSREFVCEPKAL